MGGGWPGRLEREAPGQCSLTDSRASGCCCSTVWSAQWPHHHQSQQAANSMPSSSCCFQGDSNLPHGSQQHHLVYQPPLSWPLCKSQSCSEAGETQPQLHHCSAEQQQPLPPPQHQHRRSWQRGDRHPRCPASNAQQQQARLDPHPSHTLPGSSHINGSANHRGRHSPAMHSSAGHLSALLVALVLAVLPHCSWAMDCKPYKLLSGMYLQPLSSYFLFLTLALCSSLPDSLPFYCTLLLPTHTTLHTHNPVCSPPPTIFFFSTQVLPTCASQCLTSPPVQSSLTALTHAMATLRSSHT